jgi:homoserine kinase
VSAPVELAVRVPGSSANLGPGFDALGLALDLHVEAGIGDAPDGTRSCDAHHPACIAFVESGGAGPVWMRTSIPMGRGLGYSAAARVAGACLAVAQRSGTAASGPLAPDDRAAVLELVTRLEGHADNAAASLYGGLVATAAGRVVPVTMGFEPAVVVWIPDITTSTDRSRTALPESVGFDDAAFNVGRTALLLAAMAAGDVAALRDATADRLHQDRRLGAVPGATDVLAAGLAAGAWCGWLSGSGPSVAFLCEPSMAPALAAALGPSGHTKVVAIAGAGATMTAVMPPG